MSTTDDRPYCTDCPDRESCRQGYPCDIVRTINDTSPKGNTIMSTNAKPGPRNTNENTDGEKNVPNQKPGAATAEANLIEASKGLGEYINTKAIRALKDEGLSNEEIADKTGLTPFAVLAVLSEDELVESKVEKLKGFFKRNKSTVVGIGAGAAVVALAALKIYTGSKKTTDTAESDPDDVYTEVTTDEV